MTEIEKNIDDKINNEQNFNLIKDKRFTHINKYKNERFNLKFQDFYSNGLIIKYYRLLEAIISYYLGESISKVFTTVKSGRLSSHDLETIEALLLYADVGISTVDHLLGEIEKTGSRDLAKVTRSTLIDKLPQKFTQFSQLPSKTVMSLIIERSGSTIP